MQPCTHNVSFRWTSDSLWHLLCNYSLYVISLILLMSLFATQLVFNWAFWSALFDLLHVRNRMQAENLPSCCSVLFFRFTAISFSVIMTVETELGEQQPGLTCSV